MADSGDGPPEERPPDLPRRVPGASGGLTPGQVKRGFLPKRVLEAASQAAAEAATSDSASQVSQQQEPDEAAGRQGAGPAPDQVSAGSPLPRRSPGASAIQPPPRLSRHPPVPQLPTPHPADTVPPPPAQPGPSATAPPSPPPTRPSSGGTAASLVRATTPVPATRSAPRPGRSGAGRARRLRLAGLLIAIALVLAAVLTLILAQRAHTGANRTTGGASIAAEAAVRGEAATWVASQVGRDIVVACDEVTCADLAQHGFPAGNLNVLQVTAPDPYGSALVVATAGIRSQFGTRLWSVYAPTVIASFGTGANRVDIRVIAPRGPAAYRAALSRDLQARRNSGAQLVGSKRITFSLLARQQLKAGQVDLRLVTAIAFLSAQQPLSLVGFGGLTPGADPGVPLRYAYLAETDHAARLTRARYLQAVVDVIRALRPPYVPNNVGITRLPSGQEVLRIEFPAPSPLGLLQS